MPITGKKTTRNIFAGLALGMILFSSSLFALSRQRPRARWCLALDGSYLIPAQSAVKKTYESNRFPVTLRISYRITGGAGIYTGFRYFQALGWTRIQEPVVNEEEKYRTELKVYGPQAGILYRFSLRKIHLIVASGLSYHYYREAWRDAPYSVSGKCLGYQADAHIAIPLIRGLSAFLKLEYLSIPTKKGSLLLSNVDLGGFETGIGLMFHF